MPNTNSAKKRLRQNVKRRLRNRARRTRMRNAIRAFREAIETGDLERASQLLPAAISVIDRTAGKGVIHRNQAARRKSRLTRQLQAMQAAQSQQAAAGGE